MAGIIIGIILIVLSVPIGIAIIAMAVTGTARAFTSAEQFVSDGSSYSVAITGTKQMAIWIDTSTTPGACQMTDPSGNDVNLNEDITDQFVNNWWSYAAFTPDGDGTYTITCSPDFGGNNFDYIVAPDIVNGSTVGGLIGGIAAGFVAFVVGVVLIIVTAVRRGKWTSTYGGTPGMAYGQPMPLAPPQAWAPAQQPPASPYPGQQPPAPWGPGQQPPSAPGLQ